MVLKKQMYLLFALCAFAAMPAIGQELKYYDAKEMQLLGKAIDDSASERYFMRLPDSIQGTLERPYLYTLGTNTAGMAVRFATASPVIEAKWTSTYRNNMNHMTACGTRGLDLYTLDEDGKSWTFVNSGLPAAYSNQSTYRIIGNMVPKMREYMLYLSLYDGIDTLMIGVDPKYEIVAPSVKLPVREKPIVMYGTSILQGGCANRPGMAHTNILERRLNREVINLGFSGMGQLDLQVARVIAAVKDPGMVVLDMVPNANVEQMDTLLVPFFNIIRAAHPDVPVLFVEDPTFTHSKFDKNIRAEIEKKNKRLAQHYKSLKNQGVKNIYYLEGKDILGHDLEATVDGIHMTDLGFVRFSDLLFPIINKYSLK